MTSDYLVLKLTFSLVGSSSIKYLPRSLQCDELPALVRTSEAEPRYPEPTVGRQPLLGRQHRQRRHDRARVGGGRLDLVGVVVGEVVEVLAEGDERVALPGARKGLQVLLVHL